MALDPKNTMLLINREAFAVLENWKRLTRALTQQSEIDLWLCFQQSITVFAITGVENPHLKKLNDGRKIYFEKLIGEIVNDETFPTNLSLNE